MTQIRNNKISYNGLFQKNIQTGGVEDLEFPGVLKKKHVESPGSIKKEVEIPGVFKKS